MELGSLQVMSNIKGDFLYLGRNYPISFISRVMRVRRGVEAFFITSTRHFNQPERKALIDFFLPASVLAPVLIPP